jgi:hypothetical protein
MAVRTVIGHAAHVMFLMVNLSVRTVVAAFTVVVSASAEVTQTNVASADKPSPAKAENVIVKRLMIVFS